MTCNLQAAFFGCPFISCFLIREIMLQFIHTRCLDLQIHNRYVIIQHLLELLMIQSDKLAYLTDLSGSRGRTSGETALSAHSEEHEVF